MSTSPAPQRELYEVMDDRRVEV